MKSYGYRIRMKIAPRDVTNTWCIEARNPWIWINFSISFEEKFEVFIFFHDCTWHSYEIVRFFRGFFQNFSPWQGLFLLCHPLPPLNPRPIHPHLPTGASFMTINYENRLVELTNFPQKHGTKPLCDNTTIVTWKIQLEIKKASAPRGPQECFFFFENGIFLSTFNWILSWCNSLLLFLTTVARKTIGESSRLRWNYAI
jgi:hypothetical protein